MIEDREPKVQEFRRRGFSDNIAAALVDGGIKFPEALANTCSDCIQKIPGVGKLGLMQVHAYVRRFMSEDEIHLTH